MARFREALTDPRIELLINSQNEGYAGGNNRGIERALADGADYLFVLNNDTVADPGCLTPLVEAMQRDRRIGIAGCPLIDIGYESSPNCGQRIRLFSGRTSHWPYPEAPLGPTDVDFVCGAAIMLRGETLRRIGAFDASFFLVCEDADLCFRARKAGYRICFVPGSGVRHLMSATLKRFPPTIAFYGVRNRAWLIRRHGNLAHQLVFNVLGIFYFYPRAVLARLLRGEFELVRPVLKGIWEGYWRYPKPNLRVPSELGRGSVANQSRGMGTAAPWHL